MKTAIAVNLFLVVSLLASCAPVAGTPATAPAAQISGDVPEGVLEHKFTLELTCRGIAKPVVFLVDPKVDEIRDTTRPAVGPHGELLAGRWMADEWLPLIIKCGMKPEPAGVLQIIVKPAGEDKVYRLWPVDRAAAVYAVQHLAPAPAWMDAVDPPANAPAQPPFEVMTDFTKLTALESYKMVPTDTPDAMAAAKAGVDAYNSRRAEILRTIGRSWLWYPPIPQLPATIYQHGSDYVMRTGQGDRMYFSEILLTLRKDGQNQWRCIDIRGGEFFKGE